MPIKLGVTLIAKYVLVTSGLILGAIGHCHDFQARSRAGVLFCDALIKCKSRDNTNSAPILLLGFLVSIYLGWLSGSEVINRDDQGKKQKRRLKLKKLYYF